jgi:hypothetical protein
VDSSAVIAIDYSISSIILSFTHRFFPIVQAMATEKSVEHSNIETVDRPDAANHDGKSALMSDNFFEHEQTVFQVIRSHPVLIWWAFFFSVSAIGW